MRAHSLRTLAISRQLAINVPPMTKALCPARFCQRSCFFSSCEDSFRSLSGWAIGAGVPQLLISKAAATIQGQIGFTPKTNLYVEGFSL